LGGSALMSLAPRPWSCFSHSLIQVAEALNMFLCYVFSMKKVIAGLGAILFDMDGTLVSSTPAVEKCWEAWAIKQQLPVDDVIHYIHGRPARDSIRHFTPHLNEETEVAWMLERELQEHEGIIAIAGARELLLSLGDFPWAIVTSA